MNDEIISQSVPPSVTDQPGPGPTAADSADSANQISEVAFQKPGPGASTCSPPEGAGVAVENEHVEIRRLAIADITIGAGTRVRAGVDKDAVCDYAASMKVGAIFPNIVVFSDGSRYYLADGAHRLKASIKIGRTEITAEIRKGDAKDALWYALGANRNHGLRLTDGDKKLAVTKALLEFPELSQTQVAEQVGCAQSYVNKIKKSLPKGSLADPAGQDITGDNLGNPGHVTGKDGKSYPATRRPKAKPQSAPASAETATLPSDPKVNNADGDTAPASDHPAGHEQVETATASTVPSAAPNRTGETVAAPTAADILRAVVSLARQKPTTPALAFLDDLRDEVGRQYPALIDEVKTAFGPQVDRPKKLVI